MSRIQPKIDPRPTKDQTLERIKDWFQQNLHLPTIYGSVQTKRLPTRLLDLRPCNSPKALQEIEPLQDFVQLVDSHKWDPDVVKFTTLSHRWSNEPHLTTKTENLPNHYLRICTSDLCQTFQDAIFVTRALGIRYLWIDALCIIQGDDDD